MTYWKGLMIAVAIDLVWIMARPTGTQPATVAPLDVVAEWPDESEPADSPTVDDLLQTGQLIDSMMVYLQEHPYDVDAMERLASIYADNGWWDAAIGPLARALELDRSRRSLWVALEKAVEKSGREIITDAELVRRANEFKKAVAMAGDGC